MSVRRAYRCEACRIGFVCISARGLSVRKAERCEACQAHRRIGMSRLSGSQGRTVRGLSVRRAGRCEACQQVRRRISTRTCRVRVAVRCQRQGQFPYANRRGVLSVRKAGRCEACWAHRHIGTSRLSGSQGRTVRDLSAHKRIGMTLVSSSSKVQAPVGQQYDANIGVKVRGRHAVGCEPSGQTGGQMPIPFLSYRQTEPVMSSNLAASSSMATRYALYNTA